MILLAGKKELSTVSWAIKRPNAPEKVRVSLKQTAVKSAIPCVQSGDYVQVGQKIADPSGPEGVAVHTSVSGKVTAIDYFSHPSGGEALAVEIHAEIQQKALPDIGNERAGWQSLSHEEMIALLQENGVIDTATGEPVHRHCSQNRGQSVSALIFDACESEPYLTSDYSLMMSHPVEILKGAEILRQILGAKKVIIAIEENKLEAAELLKSKAYFLKWSHFEIQVLKTRYPQGAPELLIKKFAPKDEDPSLPSVLNVATAFSVYDAIVMQKPFYERVVTVGGECVVDSCNVWVPLGTSFEDTFKFCRGLLREPGRVLMNGPMTGTAQKDLQASMVGHTQAILALPKEFFPVDEINPCIRCNQCVESCPVDISPVMISLSSEKDEFELAQDWGADQCIECGNCSYVCPSKRPMVELIRYARTGVQQPSRFDPSRKIKILPSSIPLRSTKKELFVGNF